MPRTGGEPHDFRGHAKDAAVQAPIGHNLARVRKETVVGVRKTLTF
jgi:hypothetical protein